MKSPVCMLLLFIVLFSGSLNSGHAQDAGPGCEGTWRFVQAGSTDIVTWGNTLPQVDISAAEGKVRVLHELLDRGSVAFADTFEFSPGRGEVTSVARSEIWPENWFMGVLSGAGDPRSVSGHWLEPEKSFRVVTRQTVRTSQGKTAVTTTRDYTLGPGGKTLTLSEKRSSRPSPVVLLFERKEPSH